MKIKTLILCASLLALIVACKDKMSPDERIYKQEATELSKIITNLLKIKMDPKMTPLPNDRGMIYEYDTQRRDAFLKKTEKDWLTIAKGLKDFAMEYPNSKWADDAAFCRAIEFAFIKTPIGIFKIEKVSAIRDFLEDYKNFEIEKWTKRRFSTIHEIFFDNLPSEIAVGLSETEIIRGGLYLLLISHFVLEGDLQEAEKELKSLESNVFHKFFMHTAKRLINNYKKSSRNK